MKVRISKQAQAEIEKAAEWYEGQREGLGGKFVDRVKEAVGKIGDNPQGYAKAFRELRRCNLTKFPYALWFEIRPDKSLVVACLHYRRDKVLVKERAAGVVEIPKPKRPV